MTCFKLPYRLIMAVTMLIISAVYSTACTSKKITTNTGDNKIYNDDSEINMKKIEKSTKMPFDTTTLPVNKRKIK